MTGGVERAVVLNEALAVAAEKANIPMGIGSQKAMARDVKKLDFFNVRKVAPNLFLIGNLGAADLMREVSLSDVLRLIDSMELNAFALHLNALQECVQPEGSRNFRDVLNHIEKLVQTSPVPVIVKEVGAGISADDFRRLAATGVAAVDVGGRGGTSWSRIEGERGSSEDKRIGELFANWGLSTAESVMACARARFSCENPPQIVATGGIRDGLMVAKAVAMGASMCGVALPFLRKAMEPQEGEDSAESVLREIRFFERSLRIAMFCSGVKNLSGLATVVRTSQSCRSC
jgi:isopentenyl-diphosphate delta-isomerase